MLQDGQAAAKPAIATRPLESVWIDTFVSEVVVVNENGDSIGRPTISVCVDEATGYPLGFNVSFHPPSNESIMACLAHAILPKRHLSDLCAWGSFGIPETVILDHGLRNGSSGIEQACAALGISLGFDHLPSRTLLKGLDRFLVEKADDPRDDLGFPLLPGKKLRSTILVYLVDHYAQEPVGRGSWRTRAQLWANLVSEYPPAITPNEEIVVAVLLLRSAPQFGREDTGLNLRNN